LSAPTIVASSPQYAYQNLSQIHEGVTTIIYRGTRESDSTSVILKTLKAEYPTLEEITRLRHEYKILQRLNIEGVVKALSLETYNNKLALILEDFQGISLHTWLKTQKISILFFLSLARQLAEILHELHQNYIIHKNIKPHNILINPQTEQIKLIDFSIASRLSRENPTISTPNLLEGTLAYMSPEQTGRMNRSLDYRTDFYSLGVTFYEMLTNRLPFASNDPIELVHCHIAKTPTPPHQLNVEIPQALSSIVMKLLAKTSEDRYQSAFGLKVDLEEIWEKLQVSSQLEDFIPGRLDRSGCFLIPQKLYGREREVTALINAFERTSKGSSELMLVSGYSGIGKTSVVNEVHKPIVAKRGYFISGKFDQFKRNIPYAALIQAFQELIRQLLTESSEKIAIWKEKLQEALGSNGRVIMDVIPEVNLIVGQQPDVAILGSIESQNRFNRVFQQFLSVFTKPEHPLVIFLDDLQWADLASLKLLELLIANPNSQYLLLIGAYRDNEVSPTHPTMLAIKEIQKNGAIVNSVDLQSLKIDSVTQLVCDTLDRTQKAHDLAELIFKKTQGNPFFITQFFKTLHLEKQLIFDFMEGCWKWDIKEIQTLGITDSNVVELVVTNIQRLPESAQEILKLAACIGNQFTLDILVIVSKETPSSIANKLWSALQMGLILPLSNDYKIPLVFEEGDWRFKTRQQHSVYSDSANASSAATLTPPISYKFLHDRVQQAAYSLIPDDHKKATHLRIGQLLLEKTANLALEDHIFDIVNQLNIGVDLITAETEKEELANLNLIAGRKAKAALAYEPAARYLTMGLELLAEIGWKRQYELTLALHIEAAEVAYLNTDFERTEQLIQAVLQQGRTLLHKVKAFEIKIQAYIARGQLLEAVKMALQILKLLGVNLPEQPKKLDSFLGLVRTQMNLSFKPIKDIYNLPQMTDPIQLAAMSIMNIIFAAVFITVPDLFPLTVFKQINLSIKYGNAPTSAFAYANYGLILCGIVGNIEIGSQFGQLALSLLEQLNANPLKAKIFFLVNFFVRHWKEPLRSILTPLQEGYQIGLETGDIEYAAHCECVRNLASVFSGQELECVEREMANFHQVTVQLKQELNQRYNGLHWQAVLNLLGQAENLCCLRGGAYDELRMLPIHLAANDRTGIFYVYFWKLLLCYLFGSFREAVKNADCAKNYLQGATGSFPVPILYFYDSLARLSVWNEVDRSEQKHLLKQVTSNQNKMKEWAYYAPMNYQHKYDIVEAEKARILRKNGTASELYHRAIIGAKDNGYIQEEALANELSAKFYLANGKEKIAQPYLIDAYYGYARWGAKAKVRDLEARYPQSIAKATSRDTYRSRIPDETLSSPKATTSTMIEDSRVLDLATVMKASLALSEEIVLDKLLSKLMKVIIEHAGAQKGFLIVEKSGRLFVEAARAIDSEEVMVLHSIPVENNLTIPAAIINYVERTQETLVLNDAAKETIFATDSYIVTNQPKSVLCSPIINQGKRIGILYLENNQCTGAFTSERLEVLNILTSQAAISLENARLYNNLETANSQLEEAKQQLEEYSHTLEAKVEDRTQELQEKNRQLEQTLVELRTAQKQIVAQEKLASLGALTAGIAHEIRNPLNFVTSLATLSEGLTTELSNALESQVEQGEGASPDAIRDLLTYLKRNVCEINQQGQRANTIIQSMLMHAHSNSSQSQTTDLNALVTQAAQLAYHSQRAKESSFHLTLNINCDDSIGQLELFPSDFSRAIINIVDNACYATLTKHKQSNSSFTPTVNVTTKNCDVAVEIRIQDNGIGIAPDIREKIFNPFFTTKPTGQGTGLGLSLTHDIIVGQHRGTLDVKSELGAYTEILITLPKNVEMGNG
jgi:predicted ATPase/signal transduction histidine kinase/tRNA A-37 threonylcarbamoyl transferase component Bud32